MGDRTGIEWTDATWNPVSGCDKVSPGCDRCYAETVATRFAGTPAYPDGFAVTLWPERLTLPLRWKKPRRIFVNSMSDLFHDSIPDAYIGAVFDIMARAEHHTFQVLTKRHGRMRSLLTRWARGGIESDAGYAIPPHRPLGTTRRTAPLWTPPPNVWLGVSVEDQKRADLRIPALLQTPAAVRFISAEPLLGSVAVFRPYGCGTWPHPSSDLDMVMPADNERVHASRRCCQVDWVIVGGESGKGARPMHPAWARSIREQCESVGVPFLFKQWGEWTPDRPDGFGGLPRADQARRLVTFAPDGERYDGKSAEQWQRMTTMYRAGKKAAGRALDGVIHDGYPTTTERATA